MIIQNSRSAPTHTNAAAVLSMMISQSVLNAYQNLSKLCQNLFPSCFRIILFLLSCSLYRRCRLPVGAIMQTNFNENTHWHTFDNHWEIPASSTPQTWKLEKHITQWRTVPAHTPQVMIPFSLLFLREYFIYIHRVLSSSFAIVSCIMFHFTHISPWADFSFTSCLWPASSRGINHFSFYFEFFCCGSTSAKDIFRGRRALRAVQLSSKRFLIAVNNGSGHCIRPLYSEASAVAGISITTWANNGA